MSPRVWAAVDIGKIALSGLGGIEKNQLKKSITPKNLNVKRKQTHRSYF